MYTLAAWRVGGTLRPYVVRFVSRRSGEGKTLVATRVVEALVKAGYSVGVVKHSLSGITLEEKDSARFLRAGAPEVVVATRELVLRYSRGMADDLEELASYVGRPLVVAEGFKEARLGDSVVVVESLDEVSEPLSGDAIAVALSRASREPVARRVGEVPVFTADQSDELAGLILKRALKHYVAQLPNLNCGACGVSSCEALALKVLRGERRTCPVTLGVRVVVNDREIPLNPFAKRVVSSVLEGLLGSLKGVPSDVKRITVTIEK